MTWDSSLVLSPNTTVSFSITLDSPDYNNIRFEDIEVYVNPNLAPYHKAIQGVYNSNSKQFDFIDVPNVQEYWVEIFYGTITLEKFIIKNGVTQEPISSNLYVIPQDKLWSFQWSHHITGVAHAWDLLNALHNYLKFGNGELVVNINDDGVQSDNSGTASHKDLSGKTIAVSGSKLDKAVAFLDIGNTPPLSHHENITGSHGTNCAGVVLANSDNNLSYPTPSTPPNPPPPPNPNQDGIKGVAPNCRFIATNGLGLNLDQTYFLFKWAAGFDVDNYGWSSIYGLKGTSANNFKSATSAVSAPMHISTNSFGNMTGSSKNALHNIMTSFGRNRRGILIFQAAGNEDRVATTKPKNLGSHFKSMLVAASSLHLNGREKRAKYSNWFEPFTIDTTTDAGQIQLNEHLDFSAPSNALLSTYCPPTSYANFSTTLVSSSTTVNLPPFSRGLFPYNRNTTSIGSLLDNTFQTFTIIRYKKTDEEAPILNVGTGAIDINNTLYNTIAVAENTAYSNQPLTSFPVINPVTNSIPPNAIYIKNAGVTATSSHNDVGQVSIITEETFSVIRISGNPLLSIGDALQFGNIPRFTTSPTQITVPPPIGDDDYKGGSVQFAKILAVDSSGPFNLYTLNTVIKVPNSTPIFIGTPPPASEVEMQISSFGGTSAACPFAAGIAALVLSANPNLTYAEARHIMRQTAVPIDLRMYYNRGGGDGFNFSWRDKLNATIVENSGLLKTIDINQTPTLKATYITIEDIEQSTLTSNVDNIQPPVTSTAVGSPYYTKVSIDHSIELTQFESGSAVLIGTETLLSQTANHTTNTIIVDSINGFVKNQSIVIEDGLTTTLISEALQGSSYLFVMVTDSFIPSKVQGSTTILGHKITITSSTTGLSESHFINAVVKNETVGEVVFGGPGKTNSYLIIDSPLNRSYPKYSTVTLARKETKIIDTINIATKTITLTSDLDHTHSPSTHCPVIVRTTHASLAVIDHYQDNNNGTTTNDNDIFIYPALPDDVVTSLKGQATSGLLRLALGAIPYYNPALGYGRLDAYRAVRAAIEYDYSNRDIVIRNSINEVILASTPNHFRTLDSEIIESPDLWVEHHPSSSSPTTILPYNTPGSHESIKPTLATGEERTILVRVKNAGVESAFNFSVQAYFSLIEQGADITIDDYNWQLFHNPHYNPIKAKDENPPHVSPIFENPDNGFIKKGSFIIRQDSNYRNQSYTDSGLTSAQLTELAEKEFTFIYGKEVGLKYSDASSNTFHLETLLKGITATPPPPPSNHPSETIVHLKWPQDALPDRGNIYNHNKNVIQLNDLTETLTSNKILLPFLLADATPHDGPFKGVTARDNNNMTYKRLYLGHVVKFYHTYDSAHPENNIRLHNHLAIPQEERIKHSFFIEVEGNGQNILPTDVRIIIRFQHDSDPSQNKSIRHRYYNNNWILEELSISNSNPSWIPDTTSSLLVKPPTDLSSKPKIVFETEFSDIYSSVTEAGTTFDLSKAEIIVDIPNSLAPTIEYYPIFIIPGPNVNFFIHGSNQQVPYTLLINDGATQDLSLDITISPTPAFDFLNTKIYIKAIDNAGDITEYIANKIPNNNWSFSAPTGGALTVDFHNNILPTAPVTTPPTQPATFSIDIQGIDINNCSRGLYVEVVTPIATGAKSDAALPYYKQDKLDQVISHNISVILLDIDSTVLHDQGTPQLVGTEDLHIFTELPKVNNTQAYGVQPNTTGTTDNVDKFFLTTLFTNTIAPTANVSVFAPLTGVLFIQKYQDNGQDFYSVVIRPIYQSKAGFTKVKYFIFRGITATYFEDPTNTNFLRKPNPNNLSTLAEKDLVNFLYNLHFNRAKKSNNLLTFQNLSSIELSSLGHRSNSQALEDELDTYFNHNSNNDQLPIVKKGMVIGEIAPNESLGFEIILAEGDYSPTIGSLRQKEHILDVSLVTNISEKTLKKQDILNYIDPAAYYGLHYLHGVQVANIPSSSPAILDIKIYEQVLQYFLNKNRFYIDIRDAVGDCINRLTPYTFDLTFGTTTNKDITFADTTHSNWPIYYLDLNYNGDQGNAGIDLSLFTLQLSKFGTSNQPVLYLEYGYSNLIDKNSSTPKLLDHSYIVTGTNWAKTSPISFIYALYNYDPSNNTTAITTNKGFGISGILKLRYFTEVAPPTTGSTDYPYTDLIFGPIQDTAYSAIPIKNIVGTTLEIFGNFQNKINNRIQLHGTTAPIKIIPKAWINTENAPIPFETASLNFGTITLPAATFDNTTGITTIQFTHSSGGHFPIAGDYLILWGEKNISDHTEWEVNLGRRLIDVTGTPNIGISYVGEMAVIVEHQLERVIFLTQPVDLFKTKDKTEELAAAPALSLVGGSSTETSFWKYLQNTISSLLLKGVNEDVSGSTITGYKLEQNLNEVGSSGQQTYAMALCITFDEFESIRNKCLEKFSPFHLWHFQLNKETNPLLTTLSEFTLTAIGRDRNAPLDPDPAVNPKTISLNPIIRLYSPSNAPHIFISKDYAAVSNNLDLKDGKDKKLKDTKIELKLILDNEKVNHFLQTAPPAVTIGLDSFIDNFPYTITQGNLSYIENFADSLWQDFAGSNYMDDRYLYWIRLYVEANIIQRLEQFGTTEDAIKDAIFYQFKIRSRGITQINFSNAPFNAKKVLIIAFDPHIQSLNYSTIDYSTTFNVGGRAALHLHDKTLTTNNNSIFVQSVVLPLRFDDLDDINFDRSSTTSPFDQAHGIIARTIIPLLDTIDSVFVFGRGRKAKNNIRPYDIARFAAVPRHENSMNRVGYNIRDNNNKMAKQLIKKPTFTGAPLFYTYKNDVLKQVSLKTAHKIKLKEANLNFDTGNPAQLIVRAANSAIFPKDKVYFNQSYYIDDSSNSYNVLPEIGNNDPANNDSYYYKFNATHNLNNNKKIRQGSSEKASKNVFYNEVLFRILMLRESNPTPKDFYTYLIDLPHLDDDEMDEANDVVDFVEEIIKKSF